MVLTGLAPEQLAFPASGIIGRVEEQILLGAYDGRANDDRVAAG
jgi:hypothetical protein